MISIRADENRYVIAATPHESAILRKIPGVRYVAATGALHAPRQAGTILALDELFGPEGWTAHADLSQEVTETRNQQHEGPKGEATVELQGKELAVTCQYSDKELVKLVPGYRWSAPQRRWHLPAQPMALDILERHFGAALQVAEGVREYLDLRAIDERDAIDRASRQPQTTPATIATRPQTIDAMPLLEAAEEVAARATDAPAPTGDSALLERLDRLATAVEELVGVLRGTVVPAAQVGAAVAVEAEPEQSSPAETGDDWRELIARLDANPSEVRDQSLRLAQTAPEEQEGSYRAVAGIAMTRLGHHADALAPLRRALDGPFALEEDLTREATAAYIGSVLAVLREECGPLGPLTSEQDFRDRLFDELVNDNGFDGQQIGSAEARARLDYLVNDPVLRRIDPVLSDYVRMAHLLGVARGGQWMAATRITDILREQNLGDEAFALALILLANALNGQASVNDWDKAWPVQDVAETLDDLSWLVSEAERRLKSAFIEPAMAEAAALSSLSCIAGGPEEWASFGQRRALVKLISPLHPPRREYAEFLAAFQPAAAGKKAILDPFPGWIRILAKTRLARSASYLMDVAANDSGGSNSLTWAMAEHVYLEAMALWGIEDAQAEMIDLLDLLEGGRRPDNYLNAAAALVEDSETHWYGRVSRDQRRILYRRALDASLKERHNRDALEAFDRLIRELMDEGQPAHEEVISLCVRLSTAMRAVQGPALEVLLGIQLDRGLPFEETAEQFIKLEKEYENAEVAIAGMFHLYPEFREWWNERQPLEVELTRTTDGPPSQKLLIVGGHKWLEHRVKPVLVNEWNMRVSWFDATEAKRGIEPILKARSADMVVVNAACIGHSASGRVQDAAKSAGVPVVVHHERAAGSMLSRLALELHRAASPA